MNSVIVWSKDACTFCEQAKSLLKSRNIPFEERRVGDGWTREDFFAAVPNARTFPQIVINDDVIGGFTELKAMLP